MLLLMLLPSEVELEILLLLTASAAPASASEELIEELILLLVALLSIGVLPLLLPLDALLSMLVIHSFLLCITQDFVCIRDLLELLLCSLGVVLVLVRVELYRLLFECFFNLFLGRAPPEPELLIEVLFRINTHEKQADQDKGCCFAHAQKPAASLSSC